MPSRKGLPRGSGRFWKYSLASLLLLILGPTLLGGVVSWAAARFADLVLGHNSRRDSEELRTQIVELMLENASLREQAMKADRYRLLLGWTRVSSRRAIAARVLYRTEGLIGGTMVVDRGSDDGVSVNSICLAPDGLVGVVTSCGEATSEILPLTSPQVRVSCTTRPSGAMGMLQFERGSLRIMNIDPTLDAKPGDEVVTSRFGGVYPDGLLIGTVVSVDESGSSLALSATVTPAVDFESLGEVIILLKDSTDAGRIE